MSTAAWRAPRCMPLLHDSPPMLCCACLLQNRTASAALYPSGAAQQAVRPRRHCRATAALQRTVACGGWCGTPTSPKCRPSAGPR